MNTSLSPLLVVVVVVVGTLTDAAPRSGYGDDSVTRSWPWLPGYLPSRYSSPSLYPSSADGYLGSYDDYPEASLRKSMIEDFNRRVMEAQRRCHDDFMILRRLLEEQNHPLRGPALDTPWYFPVFRFPYMPERGLESEEEEEKEEKDRKKKKPTKTEEEEEKGTEEEYSDEYPGDYEGNGEDSGASSELDNIASLFEDSPTPGPEWQIIPLLPEVPDADDLPDKYDNSTHTIHILNGSRVEVNTTTHKDSGDVVTTFYHTEVINILPDESEEDTTEEPLPEETTDEGATETPEESTKDETHNEDPDLAVPAELKDLFKEVNSGRKTSISDTRPAREATEDPLTSTTPTTGPKAQHLAAYVKAADSGADSKGKGKDSTASHRDLSGDTLVNNLPGSKKGGKEKDPDAEIISSEELF